MSILVRYKDGKIDQLFQNMLPESLWVDVRKDDADHIVSFDLKIGKGHTTHTFFKLNPDISFQIYPDSMLEHLLPEDEKLATGEERKIEKREQRASGFC